MAVVSFRRPFMRERPRERSVSASRAPIRSSRTDTPMPGAVGNGDGAVGGHLNRRVDQVGIEIAPARGDVAGQRRSWAASTGAHWRRGRCPTRACRRATPECRATRTDRAAGPTRPKPPTRPGLMLMIRQAPAAIASRATPNRLDRLVEADRRLQPRAAARRDPRCRRSPAAARSSSGRSDRAVRDDRRRPACRRRWRRP